MPQRSYPKIYEEIFRIIKDGVTETKTARAIMRRSGFRPHSSEDDSSGGSVLTLPPCAYTAESEGGGGGGEEIPCESMPTAFPEFDNHDFDMPCTLYGANPVGPPFPFNALTYTVWNAYPEASAQVEDPEFIWLSASDTNTTALVNRWGLTGRAFSGETYYPVVRVRLTYSMSAHKRTNYSLITGSWVGTERWGVPPPLLAFRIITLNKPPPLGTEQTTADPLTSENYPNAGSNSAGVTNVNRWFPEGNRWPWHPSREHPGLFTGPFLSTSALYAAVSSYTSTKAAIDPTVTVTPDALSPTLTFDHTTDASAIYLPWTPCLSFLGMAVTAIAAGWIVNRSNGNSGMKASETNNFNFVRAATYRYFDLSDPATDQAHTPFVNPYGPGGMS